MHQKNGVCFMGAVINHHPQSLQKIRAWKNSLLVSSRGRKIWSLMSQIESKQGSSNLAGRVSFSIKQETSVDRILDIALADAQSHQVALQNLFEKNPLEVQDHSHLLEDLLDKDYQDTALLKPLTMNEVKKILAFPWEDALSTSALAAILSKQFKLFQKGSLAQQTSEIFLKGSEFWFLGSKFLDICKSNQIIKTDEQQRSTLEQALQPVKKGPAREEVKAQAKGLQRELISLRKSEQGLLSIDYWQTSIKLLLLQVQLYPKKYANEREVLAVELKNLNEKIAASSTSNLASKNIFALNIFILGSKSVEAALLPGSIVSLALKVFSFKKSWGGIKKTYVDFFAEKKKNIALDKDYQVLKETFKENPAALRLIATSEKVKTIVKAHQQINQTQNVLLKSLGFLYSATGISSLALKITAMILGSVGLISATIASLGLVSLILMVTILVVRVVIHAYRNRDQIRLSLQQAALSIKIAAGNFFHSDQVYYLEKQQQRIKQKINKLELASKTSNVSQALMKEYAQHLEAFSHDPEFTTDSAQRIIRLCTGQEGRYLSIEKTKEISIHDLKSRMLASFLDQMIT
jgi:hypothetical protein